VFDGLWLTVRRQWLMADGSWLVVDGSWFMVLHAGGVGAGGHTNHPHHEPARHHQKPQVGLSHLQTLHGK